MPLVKCHASLPWRPLILPVTQIEANNIIYILQLGLTLIMQRSAGVSFFEGSIFLRCSRRTKRQTTVSPRVWFCFALCNIHRSRLPSCPVASLFILLVGFTFLLGSKNPKTPQNGKPASDWFAEIIWELTREAQDQDGLRAPGRGTPKRPKRIGPPPAGPRQNPPQSSVMATYGDIENEKGKPRKFSSVAAAVAAPLFALGPGSQKQASGHSA